MNIILKSTLIFTSLLAPLSMLTSCSSKKTTTETVVVEESRLRYNEDTPATKTITTSTETEESASCGGILSCTVDGIGTVIALPFRLVGAIIGIIF